MVNMFSVRDDNEERAVILNFPHAYDTTGLASANGNEPCIGLSASTGWA
jgi:hypothetical protein